MKIFYILIFLFGVTYCDAQDTIGFSVKLNGVKKIAKNCSIYVNGGQAVVKNDVFIFDDSIAYKQRILLELSYGKFKLRFDTLYNALNFYAPEFNMETLKTKKGAKLSYRYFIRWIPDEQKIHAEPGDVMPLNYFKTNYFYGHED